MLEQFKSKQFIIFLITGGVAALVNFFSRLLYNHWLDFSWSVILAYVTGMVAAFILARMFVFRHSKQELHRSVAFFALVNLMAVAQTWLISMGLAQYLLPTLKVQAYSLEIAHAVGISIPVFTSYLGHKHLSFK